MPSIFTQIIERKIPAHIIAEDIDHIAFLDVFPRTLGHTLIVPKQEIDSFLDLPDETLSTLICFAKKIGIALQEVVPCNRISLSIIGMEVPHVHIHLIPIKKESDLHLHRPTSKVADNILETLTKKLKEILK